MTFSFKPSLAPQVESRRKITTIRDCSRRMPRAGMPFTGVTGARFAPRVIHRATILEVLPIEIDLRHERLAIRLDRSQLHTDEIARLATFEGFDGHEVMRRFFVGIYGKTVLMEETHRLIHWGLRAEHCSNLSIQNRLRGYDAVLVIPAALQRTA
jgi:hypothetical protein